MPEEITATLRLNAQPALDAVRRPTDAVRNAATALDDLSRAMSQLDVTVEDGEAAAPARPALRVVEVHRPVNGEPLFNVVDPDGQRVNQRPLPRSEADALARNHD